MKRPWIATACALLLLGGTTQAQSTLNDGLLLYYPFDEDAGPIVRDASGGGRTGEVDGATWVAQGARGAHLRSSSVWKYPAGSGGAQPPVWSALSGEFRPDPAEPVDPAGVIM